MITRTLVFRFPSEFELPGSTWDSVHQTLPANRSGASFSKVPIINGPGKLLPFTLKIEVSIVLHLT